MDLPITFRPATEDDLPFFYSATLQSHFYSSDSTHNVLSSDYYAGHKKVLQRLLRRAPLTIACDQEDQKVIMGFCLTNADTLHYMYVKRPFRRFGVARMLLKTCGISLDSCVCTHWTDDMTEIWREKRYPGLVYNPYLLME